MSAASLTFRIAPPRPNSQFFATKGPLFSPISSNFLIEARLPEGAKQLDFWTTVHHNFQSRTFGEVPSFVIAHADLPLECLFAYGNRLLGNSEKGVRASKNFNHIYLAIDFARRRINFQPSDFAARHCRVDWNQFEASFVTNAPNA